MVVLAAVNIASCYVLSNTCICLFLSDQSAVVMPTSVMVAKISVAMETMPQNASVNLFTCLPALPVFLATNNNNFHTIARTEIGKISTMNNLATNGTDTTVDGHDDLDFAVDNDQFDNLSCVIDRGYYGGRLCLCTGNIEVTYADIGQYFPAQSAVKDELQESVFLRDCLFQYMLHCCGLR